MLVTTKEMFRKAKEGNFAVIAPDFYDSNSAKTYVRTFEELKTPAILAFAEGHTSVLSIEEAALIGRYYAETAKVDIALHLDHGKSFALIKKAIDYGFTSVMIDASSCDFEENVRRTKDVVEYAHARGVVVEAEIGHVGQGDDPETKDSSVYTEVEEAVKFVDLTGVDSLAVSIGTAHGHYVGTPTINFERLHELADAVPVPLVLHGGSSSGDYNLERCATEGISKINVFTDFVTAQYDAMKSSNEANWLDAMAISNQAVKDTLVHYAHVFHMVEE